MVISTSLEKYRGEGSEGTLPEPQAQGRPQYGAAGTRYCSRRPEIPAAFNYSRPTSYYSLRSLPSGQWPSLSLECK